MYRCGLKSAQLSGRPVAASRRPVSARAAAVVAPVAAAAEEPSTAEEPAPGVQAQPPKETAQQLANRYVSAVDALRSDLASKAASLRARAHGAGGLEAFDAFAEAAVLRLRRLPQIITDDPRTRGKIDFIAAAFTKYSDNLRREVISGKTSAASAIAKLSSKLNSSASEARAAAVASARAAAAKEGGRVSVAPEPSSLLGAAAGLFQAALGLAVLYGLDQGVKAALAKAGSSLPSPAVGAAALFALLVISGRRAAGAALSFLAPASAWAFRLLPALAAPVALTSAPIPPQLAGLAAPETLRAAAAALLGLFALRQATSAPVGPILGDSVEAAGPSPLATLAVLALGTTTAFAFLGAHAQTLATLQAPLAPAAAAAPYLAAAAIYAATLGRVAAAPAAPASA